MHEQSQLRKRLREVTEAQDEPEYRALLDAAARDYPNTIVLVDSPHPIQRYTCFMHAFGFTEKPEYVAIASRGLNVVFAGPRFAHWLLDKKLLTEVVEAEAHQGDLVFYFNEEECVKHAGLNLGGQRAESKWGKGHLFQHDLFDVPELDGVKVRFFGEAHEIFDGFLVGRPFEEDNGMFLD
jgi:hypothetical protein